MHCAQSPRHLLHGREEYGFSAFAGALDHPMNCSWPGSSCCRRRNWRRAASWRSWSAATARCSSVRPPAGAERVPISASIRAASAFLVECGRKTVAQVLEAVFRGESIREERLLLEARVQNCDAGIGHRCWRLNDVSCAISKRSACWNLKPGSPQNRLAAGIHQPTPRRRHDRVDADPARPHMPCPAAAR